MRPPPQGIACPGNSVPPVGRDPPRRAESPRDALAGQPRMPPGRRGGTGCGAHGSRQAHHGADGRRACAIREVQDEAGAWTRSAGARQAFHLNRHPHPARAPGGEPRDGHQALHRTGTRHGLRGRCLHARSAPRPPAQQACHQHQQGRRTRPGAAHGGQPNDRSQQGERGQHDATGASGHPPAAARHQPGAQGRRHCQRQAVRHGTTRGRSASMRAGPIPGTSSS